MLIWGFLKRGVPEEVARRYAEGCFMLFDLWVGFGLGGVSGLASW